MAQLAHKLNYRIKDSKGKMSIVHVN
jgi:hypothetical protein